MLVSLLLVALATPALVTLTVKDPSGGVVRDYRGVPLLSMVPSGAAGDAALVRCSDGFVTLLPLAVVRKYGPVVASEVRGERGWEPIPGPRGPRYLVWPNRTLPEVDRDAAVTSEGWAWGVDGVEVVTSAAYLAPLKPEHPEASLDRGRAIWMRSCFHCHAVHGAGGLAGWDLSEPTVLWRYRTESDIARYLRDPRSVNPDGRMPAQPLTPAQLDDLLAFLHDVVR
jgi:hypothetical protein